MQGSRVLAVCAVFSMFSAAQAVTIDFWVRSSDAGFTEPLVKAFNASHSTQVKLNLVPAEQFVPKFAAAVSGGAAPDVVATDLIYMPAFAAAGQLTDITAQARALPFYKQLSPSHLRLATYGGKLYGVPFSAEGSILLYNKDLFTKAGLDPNKPPTTWQGIRDASKKITALGGGVKGFYFAGACAGCNAFTLLPLIWAAGGDVLSADGKTATLNTPAVKQALTLYRDLWKDGQIPQTAKADSGNDFLNAFTTGKIGMAGSGAFAIGTLKTKYPNVNFGVAYLPGETGKWSSFAGGDSMAIPKGSKNPKEAFEFIGWCLSDAAQIEQFAKNGSIPVRSDLAVNQYSKLDPRYVIPAKAMAGGRTPYSLVYNDLFNSGTGPWLTMIQKAVFDGDVDGAVTQAQADFTKILQRK
ncbi:ABC transporter substrate-binding protein [Deinococcus sp.]|uniref:ABC transporter substrate-binding protein n=1 Tax=Deinococcus sp. TaxID=47478 RepID=UPI003C7CE108